MVPVPCLDYVLARRREWVATVLSAWASSHLISHREVYPKRSVWCPKLFPPYDVNGCRLERTSSCQPVTVLDKCSLSFLTIGLLLAKKRTTPLLKKVLTGKSGHIIPLQVGGWQGDMGREDSEPHLTPYTGIWEETYGDASFLSSRILNSSDFSFFYSFFPPLFQGILCSAQGLFFRVKSPVSMSCFFLSILHIRSLSLTWFH